MRILLKHLLMIFFGALLIFPFLWMVAASFKSRPEIFTLKLLPETPKVENYGVVLRLQPEPYTKKVLNLNFPKWYFNSLFIASWVTALQVITSSMAAYAFSRIRWPGRDKVFLLYLSTMMIPGIVLIIPNYQIMVSLDLVNTYTGLILPQAFTAFGTFLLRQFMLSLPHSYDEAAKMDGANHLQIFLDVILPLSRPGLVTLAILTYLGNFQSFFWPLVMIKDGYLRTLPIGLMSFQSEYSAQMELLMAATVMYVLPLIVFFVFMQKQIVAGIQLDGVKG